MVKQSIHNRNVLIIEDDEDVCRMMAHALSPFDCKITTANDGATALELLLEIQPSLVILDLSLPYVSGEEVLQFIKAEPSLANTRVIIVTVHGPEYTAMFEGVADNIFQKPYRLQEFRSALSQVLDNTR